MKCILLPERSEKITYYRANLHSHSTVSDGNKSPEQLKAYYMNNGYSIVAFTDHNVFLNHNDLTDDNFLALNGFEFNIDQKTKNIFANKSCHICYIALESDNRKSICFHRTEYYYGNASKYKGELVYDENLPDYDRYYSAECINDMIEEGKKNGFFVTYNHPTWSLESYPEYMSYNGMDAMEIANYNCITEGYDDDNGRCYNDMLKGGKRIYCIAADDNHNGFDDASPKSDSFGCYTMMAAERLDYRTITKALEEGMFYSVKESHIKEAPIIKMLDYQDGICTIKTSPASSIDIIYDIRANERIFAQKDQDLTEARFKIRPESDWFRFVVTDNSGGKAYTNAYWTSNFKDIKNEK